MEELELGYNSQLFARAVEALMQLPGVGRKSAQRYMLHLLQRGEMHERFVQPIADCLTGMPHCPECLGFSDTGVRCPTCADESRTNGQLCVVADVRDQLAIERAGGFNGKYFVLGGLIDPMGGIGPEQLPIAQLLQRVQDGGIDEVILAFSVNMEGDTTTFYLRRKLEELDVKISVPARGMPFGETLEQTDEITLGQALRQRTSVHVPMGLAVED